MTAKVGIVEKVEAIIARQGHDKHVSGASDIDATIEYAVLSMRESMSTALKIRFPSNQSTSNTQQCNEEMLSVLSVHVAIWGGRACK
jgi:hypothetical protein